MWNLDQLTLSAKHNDSVEVQRIGGRGSHPKADSRHGRIRSYLRSNPEHTGKQITAALNDKRILVNSALYDMQRRGYVRSFLDLSTERKIMVRYWSLEHGI